MSPSPNTTSGVASQMSCAVSNNLILPTNPCTSAQTGWNGEIVAISPTAGSTTEASLDDLQLAAANAFVLLRFAAEDSTGPNTTSPPVNPLPVGKTASLSLSAQTSPASASDNSLRYALLFAQANNYFPVASINEVVTSDTTVTIVLPMAAPRDTSSAANAYRFLQAIMADPCSTMAQQFTAALSADINTNPVTGSCANVNAFFAQTNHFRNVDFAIYSAVSSYVFAYATAWADFQPNFTYNVYSTTTTDSGSDADPSTTSTKSFRALGSVVFAQVDQHTSPLADANAGYSITWKPNGGSAVVLNLVEGQLVSPSGDDATSVCLQTTFMDRDLFTGQASATKQASQALVGLINGVHVVGSPLPLDSPAIEAVNDGDAGITSNDATDAKMSVGAMVGIGVGILFLGAVLGTTGYLYMKGNIPSVSDIAKAMRWGRTKSQQLLKNAGCDELDQDSEDNLFQSRISENDEGLNDDSDEDFIQRAEEAEQLQNENLEKAVLEAKQISQEKSEEMNQLSVQNNSRINDEITNTNAEGNELQALNLKSPKATEALNNLENSIFNTQTEIVNENGALGLNAPQQNQFANQINSERLQDQRIDEEEDEETVSVNRNLDDSI